jgi:hypothetical protein
MKLSMILAALFTVAPSQRGVAAEAAPAGVVTYLVGHAKAQENGQWAELALKSPLAEGDRVVTAAGAKLEITLSDKSVLRLDGGSTFVLRTASLGEGGTKVTGNLSIGRLWAKVASVLGGSSHFDIEMQNAVAGVRGTTFRVDAHRDESALVRVYAGAVAVATKTVPSAAHHPSKTGEPQEVAGPREVSKKDYERLLAAMMQVKVSASGELSQPEHFAAAADDKDPWVVFNQQRDDLH